MTTFKKIQTLLKRCVLVKIICLFSTLSGLRVNGKSIRPMDRQHPLKRPPPLLDAKDQMVIRQSVGIGTPNMSTERADKFHDMSHTHKKSRST